MSINIAAIAVQPTEKRELRIGEPQAFAMILSARRSDSPAACRLLEQYAGFDACGSAAGVPLYRFRFTTRMLTISASKTPATQQNPLARTKVARSKIDSIGTVSRGARRQQPGPLRNRSEKFSRRPWQTRHVEGDDSPSCASIRSSNSIGRPTTFDSLPSRM